MNAQSAIPVDSLPRWRRRLSVILRRRGHFRIEGWLWARIARQFLAALGLGDNDIERLTDAPVEALVVLDARMAIAGPNVAMKRSWYALGLGARGRALPVGSDRPVPGGAALFGNHRGIFPRHAPRALLLRRVGWPIH